MGMYWVFFGCYCVFVHNGNEGTERPMSLTKVTQVTKSIDLETSWGSISNCLRSSGSCILSPTPSKHPH